MSQPPPPSTRPFFVLWSGQALSLLGSQAVQFALIWWLTLRTESATVLAAATFFGLLPQALLGPIIGALVDRWNRKRTLFVADAVVALASLVLAALFLLGEAETLHVFALLLIRAFGAAFHSPAMMASTSLMVPKELLARIQGLDQGLQGGLLIVSAPLGALLVGWLPMAGVMVVDVVTALAALLPLIFIRVPQPARRNGGGSTGRNAFRALGEEVAAGVRYLWRRDGHFALLAIATANNLFLVPAFALLPLLVTGRGGDALQLGWMTSGFGVGTLAGGILLAIWGGFRRRMATSLSAMAALGLAVLGIAGAQGADFAFSLLSIFAAGFFVPLVNGPIHATLQATVAPEIQGRVFTLYSSLATLAAPIGLFLAAPVAERWGVVSWYIAGGAACCLLAALGFSLPRVLNLEDDPEAAARELEGGGAGEAGPEAATEGGLAGSDL